MNTPCMYCYAPADLCAAEDPDGFVCTRATGHGGDHAACDGDDHPIDTWPRRGETTGEVLARLQATLARLLDEADAELREEADGGGAAALIEKEVEQPDAEVRELRSALARELARGNALQDALDAAESRPLTPDAITDEMVGRGRTAYPSGSDRLIRAILTAALTDPPARPEGAEKIDGIVEDWMNTLDEDPALGEADDRGSLADFLAEHGVRVVTEEKP